MLNLLMRLLASVVSGWLGQRAVTATRGALARRRVLGARSLPRKGDKATKHLRRYARRQLTQLRKRI